MDAELARRAISLLDLTDLTDDCTPAAIDSLCDRAAPYGTAAVCVWPDFVAQSTAALAGSGVRVATVVNFPSGEERPFAVGLVTERALADGADEIDIGAAVQRRSRPAIATRPSAMLEHVRRITEGNALMKVILETGELPDLDTVEAAARFAIEHGADFVKTSTGKTPVSATLPAARADARSDRRQRSPDRPQTGGRHQHRRRRGRVHRPCRANHGQRLGEPCDVPVRCQRPARRAARGRRRVGARRGSVRLVLTRIAVGVGAAGQAELALQHDLS